MSGRMVWSFNYFLVFLHLIANIKEAKLKIWKQDPNIVCVKRQVQILICNKRAPLENILFVFTVSGKLQSSIDGIAHLEVPSNDASTLNFKVFH